MPHVLLPMLVEHVVGMLVVVVLLLQHVRVLLHMLQLLVRQLLLLQMLHQLQRFSSPLRLTESVTLCQPSSTGSKTTACSLSK